MSGDTSMWDAAKQGVVTVGELLGLVILGCFGLCGQDLSKYRTITEREADRSTSDQQAATMTVERDTDHTNGTRTDAEKRPSCFLYSDDVLRNGESLREGDYELIMQSDGNLVLYDNKRPLWATGTQGRGSGCELHFESTGELVIYDGRNPIWRSGNARESRHYILILQRDRNLVVYGGATWSSKTRKRSS